MIEISNVNSILYYLLLSISIYFGISVITYIVSWWAIFKKEKIPPYYSIIPFLNIYKYYKICHLPFITVFLPIINIIVLYCSTYVITKKYRCKRWQSYLSIFLPFIFMPYIAFSKKTNIDMDIESIYVRNNKDIDKLEQELESYDNDILDEPVKKSNTKLTESISDKLINNIENNNMLDEYVYDEYQDIESKYAPVDTSINEFKELDDDYDMNILNITDMDKLEDSIKIANSVEKNIVTDKKVVEERKVANEAIAFGGKEKVENIESIKTKNDELTCKRCGSSLVGNNGFCPGCGAKIEDCV